MELRRTRPADLPALFDIFNAAIGDLYRRHAFSPPAPPYEVWASQQSHVLAHDSERAYVAEENGGPVAFASAWERGDAWFLASLFVHPNAQAHGLGSALLDAVWGDARLRLTVTDAIQPISNALYARRGLVPATPVLAFEGLPRCDAPTDVEPADAGAEEVRRLDLAAYGFDRTVDHAYWGRVARRTVWERNGEAAAWSYVFPGGATGPIAGVDAAATASALAAELARTDSAVRVRMPGSARRAVETALRARLRVAPVPGLLLLSEEVAAPDALVIGSYTLL